METIMSPNRSPEPKAVIFDLLTALLDSWSLWDTCASSPALGRAWRSKYLDLTFACGAYRPYEDLVREAALQIPDLPPPAPDALVERWDELMPWPETLEVLAALRKAGRKVGVITNCSTVLGSRAAKRCEADGFAFDKVLTAEAVGFYKPDRRAYASIIEALGMEPRDCLFVAGSAGDVVGATAAGMRVVWHNRVGLAGKEGENGEVVEPEMEARDLTDLLQEYVS